MTTAGGSETYDPRRLPRPSPAGRWTAAAPGLGWGGRGANLGWPAAAAALSGGGGLRRARTRASARLDRLLGLGARLRRRPPASAAPPGGPGQQTAPPPRPLTPGLTLNVLPGACRTARLRQLAASLGGPQVLSRASASQTRRPAQLGPRKRASGQAS